MQRTLGILAFAAVLAGGSAGCASAFIHGARLSGRGTATNGAIAAWDLGQCVSAAGAPMQGADARYYLLQGDDGLELFEASPDGSGAIITNQWNDANGTHFYAWVTNSGWEYVIPGPGQPGTRYVYTSGTSDAHPNGTWIGQCPMSPSAP